VNAVAYLEPSPEAPSGIPTLFCPLICLCSLMENSRLSRCWRSRYPHQCIPDRLDPYRTLAYSSRTLRERLLFGYNETRNDYFWILGQVGLNLNSTPKLCYINTSPRTARVWKNYKPAYELRGHTQAVWAVVAIDDDQFLTGTHILKQNTIWTKANRP
jgi:hypothetical protein